MHFSNVELEDFAGYVHVELLKDDCAKLRKFQQRSQWPTFLATVITNLAQDFQIARWGRWRPSTMAEKAGPVAIILDRLVNRDGHTIEEAIEIVRTNHAVSLTYRELRELWDRLPPRQRFTEVAEEAAAAVRSPDSSEERVEDAAIEHDVERVNAILQAAYFDLPRQERVIIALRYDHDFSAAEIARLMQLSVPTVHRRLERGLQDLRVSLSRRGLDSRDISAVIGHSRVILASVLRKEGESFLRRVRLFKRDG